MDLRAARAARGRAGARGWRAGVTCVVLAVAGCSAASGSPAGSTGTSSPVPAAAAPPPGLPAHPDPASMAALFTIAQAFNVDYGANRDGPVWDRWDPRSQRVITRAEYVRRHQLCPSAPTGAVQVVSARPAGSGWAVVRYEIDSAPLTDYWVYLAGHWRFDLVRSNPDAVALYRLPYPAYAAQLGCTTR